MTGVLGGNGESCFWSEAAVKFRKRHKKTPVRPRFSAKFIFLGCNPVQDYNTRADPRKMRKIAPSG